MIMTSVPIASGTISSLARAMIVGLALIPLTLVVIASIPALVILPFTAKGLGHVEMLINRIASWSISIMNCTEPIREKRGIASFS